MMRLFLFVFLGLLALNCNAWNAMGHQLVGQIAYDNLTPKAKLMCNKYNRSFNKSAPIGNFVVAATWLDTMRAKDVHWFDSLHYIDIPFTNEETPLPKIAEMNALVGIKQAIAVLKSQKSSSVDKGMSLRILIHVVGDIHQPLHTAALVTNKLPHGDLGGNLFPLSKNPIGINLHQYWDNGGGILIGQSKKFQVKNKALQLEQKWSCKIANTQMKPEQWVKSSHDLALSQVYKINPDSAPDKRYQLNAQNISQKQILLAGCRLANLLNEIADTSHTSFPAHASSRAYASSRAHKSSRIYPSSRA